MNHNNDGNRQLGVTEAGGSGQKLDDFSLDFKGIVDSPDGTGLDLHLQQGPPMPLPFGVTFASPGGYAAAGLPDDYKPNGSNAEQARFKSDPGDDASDDAHQISKKRSQHEHLTSLPPKKRATRAQEIVTTKTYPTRQRVKAVAGGIDQFHAKPSNEWLQRLAAIQKFKNEHGHCNPRQSTTMLDAEGNNVKIGTWVNKQRFEKKKFDERKTTSMTPAKISMLEGIGFEWAKSRGQEAWNRGFEKLKAFKKEHGHCNVPTRPEEGESLKALGRWVTSQRSANKMGKITAANKRRLDNIGFKWD